MRRRWNVTIFRNEVAADGGIKNVVVHEYKNVRSTWISGEVVNRDGTLRFTDETGREIVASSVPFVVTEIERASIEEEQRRAMERRRAFFTLSDGLYHDSHSIAPRRRAYRSA
jgi:hypothetical protein